MARKKKIVDEEVKVIENVIAEVVLGICGHRNMHYTEDVLTCALPNNHKGDHSALLNDKPTFWTDAAGKPNAKQKVSGH